MVAHPVDRLAADPVARPEVVPAAALPVVLLVVPLAAVPVAPPADAGNASRYRVSINRAA